MVLPPEVTRKSRARSIEPEAAVAPFADVAGAHPARGAEHGERGLGAVPVALEQVGRSDQDLAVVRQPHLEALRHRADVARPREGAALAGDDAAGRLGLAVHLAHVDAQHVPDRHGLGRQRRAARDDELQLVEADLAQHALEHGRAPRGVHDRGQPGCLVRPAPLDVSARKRHRPLVGEALDGRRLARLHENLCGELLQVARYGEQHGRRRLEQRGRQVLDALADVGDELRQQRQGDGDIAAQHVAQRQIGDGAVLFLDQRRIVRGNRPGRRQMLAVGDERALGMAGRAGCVDDEGRLLRLHLRDARLEPGEIGAVAGLAELGIGDELGVGKGEQRRVVDRPRCGAGAAGRRRAGECGRRTPGPRR